MEIIKLVGESAPDTSDAPQRESTQIPTWRPTLGPEFDRYVSKLPHDQAQRLRHETPRIISACIQPGSVNKNAGLVLGYVQSGKTSSFTAVSALARDNGYQCIIILGGTSNILLDQTRKRLRKDLEAGEDVSDAAWRWLWCESPKVATQAGAILVERIRVLANASDSGVHFLGGIPLVTIMKQKRHLEDIVSTFRALEDAHPGTLRKIPTLIIDDEAHMHSPDVNLTPGEFSSIYLGIRNLRELLPQHTLLQYTATPQANLLASLDDELSPDFVRLLTPGENYAGGIQFFRERQDIIQQIDPAEQQAALGFPPPDNPIASLKTALAQYLLITADDYKRAIDAKRHPNSLSMLTHGAGSNHIHELMAGWLRALVGNWQHLFSYQSSDEDRSKLTEGIFFPAYQDLTNSNDAIYLPFDELMGTISNVIALVKIQSINQQGASNVDWGLSPYNIINGGNLLGVGFTVKGLVVTHMLRTLGGAQGDTLQQRGRFFGYRKDWLNRTRVWLPPDVKYHFDQYIDQEEYLRSDLREFDENNWTLRGWKRRFRLDPAAKLCRKNAIRLDLYRFKTESSWIDQDYVLTSDKRQDENLALVQAFLKGESDFSKLRSFTRCTLANSGQTQATRHLQGEIPLRDLKLLLASYVVREENRMDFEVIRSLIDDHENDDDYQTVTVINVAADNPTGFRRRRALRDTGGFDLMQGRGAGRGNVYEGDRAVRNPSRITLQVHTIDHGPSDSQIESSGLVYLAISLPSTLEQEAQSWVQQL
jgi:hypothetical protein